MSNRIHFDNSIRRVYFNSDTQFAVNTTDTSTTLTGYALLWNVLSSDRGGYFVKLLPNSATFLAPTFALYNHNYDYPLARNDNGSLRISFDQIGAKVEIDIPNTTYGQDVAEGVRSQLIRGMSFAMLPGGDYTESSQNGMDVIEFSKFECDEVTITPIPSFIQTSIGVKLDDDSGDDDNMALNLSQKENSEVTKELTQEMLKLEILRLAVLRI